MLYGPITLAHTRLMQSFRVNAERRNWMGSFGNRYVPSDHLLLVAWHVARADCRCVTIAQRTASRRWLAARGLSCVRFNVYTGEMLISGK